MAETAIRITFSHVEGHDTVGRGRGVTDRVTCSCGWSKASDSAYYWEWRHRQWTDHVLAVLLAEVAELRTQVAGSNGSSEDSS